MSWRVEVQQPEDEGSASLYQASTLLPLVQFINAAPLSYIYNILFVSGKQSTLQSSCCERFEFLAFAIKFRSSFAGRTIN